MFFVFLGLVLIIVAPRFITKIPRVENMGRLIGGIRALGFIVILVGLLSSCVKQIDAGYIGVQSLFGKIQKRVLHSGLNVVNPFVQIRHLDTRTQNYTMSGVHDEGDKGGDDAIRVLTRDGLEVTIDLSVLYRLNPEKGPDLIRSIGIDYKDKIIRPVSRTKIRDNAVYYDAVELYSTKRDEFQQKIFQSIEKEFQLRGLILENLLVRNITLPQTVKLTIESKINAEQEAQKMQFVLQKEKQEAERKRVEAQGIADYQRIIGEGLSDKQLKYEQIKAYRELAASENSKIIVMPQSGNIILDGRQ
ncbi:MAG: prohibitin family protein [Bacteroidetes bacterium]|jgi:regulator of protease activity HflC (stomatin/prohibitin superfamily)|nr:prohibitin family protein [Bacteroidota bacterium]